MVAEVTVAAWLALGADDRREHGHGGSPRPPASAVAVADADQVAPWLVHSGCGLRTLAGARKSREQRNPGGYQRWYSRHCVRDV
jgi:hypothetical protein